MKRQIISTALALKRYIKINFLGDEFEREFLRWVTDEGDSTYRLNYPLAQNSIVFDCGGYLGEWSSVINSRYHPSIYIFEPVQSFFEHINKQFRGQPNIRIFQFGLHNRSEAAQIRINKNSSSIFSITGTPETINLVDIKDFILHHHITRVNLMKINIEGGEYDLLERIIETGIIHNIDNLQIQFHKFVPNAEERRNSIRENLGLTHRLTYDYKFIWENWAKKS